MKALKTFAAIAVVLTSFITASCGKKSPKQKREGAGEITECPHTPRVLTKEDSIKFEEYITHLFDELKNDTIKQY